jgi:hypothetical protein
MDRDRQIELMLKAEERTDGYVKRWLENPEFRASLHRYDRDAQDDAEDRRRFAR